MHHHHEGPAFDPYHEARRRHPSWNETTEPPRSPEAFRAALSLIHDYFREGDVDASQRLEIFLHENQAGIHAEDLLDRIAELADVAAQHAMTYPGGRT